MAFQCEIGVNLLMVEAHGEELELDSSGMELGSRQRAIEMPISIDELYNLIVCNDCGIGLPFEWVPAHLKDHHGIETTKRQGLAFLEFEGDAMTVSQAEDWIQSVWIGRAVQKIPVVKGYKCNECNYSVAVKGGMKNHISQEHRGQKM